MCKLMFALFALAFVLIVDLCYGQYLSYGVPPVYGHGSLAMGIYDHRLGRRDIAAKATNATAAI